MAQKSAKPTHEKRDVNAHAILLFGLWLTIAAVIVHIIVGVFYDYLIKTAPRPRAASASVSAGVLPPEPRLQSSPYGEIREVRAAQNKILNGYEDLGGGYARIPVARAMEILVEKKG